MPTKEEVYDALKYRIEVDDFGTRRYYNGVGQLHREDGPAIEWYNGACDWFQNNQLHRTDGPAIEYASGSKAWYQNGKPHRTDGPAIVHANGSMEWYQNGELHREDGPAYETIYGVKEWFLSGVEYTAQEFTAAREARGCDAD